MIDYKEYKLKPIPFQKVTLHNICGSKPVMHWAPRREEIQRFIEIAKAVHNNDRSIPTILEVGCGTGFLAYLLALTGEVYVTATDPNEEVIGRRVYSHPNMRFEKGDAERVAKNYKEKGIDVVVNSYMPQLENLTPHIRNIGAKAIIYVKDISGETGMPSHFYNPRKTPEKREDFVSYEPGEDYRKAFEWGCPNKLEIQYLSKVLRGVNARPKKSNMARVDIQVRKDIPIPLIPKIPIPDLEKYAWEKELELLGLPFDEMRRVV